MMKNRKEKSDMPYIKYERREELKGVIQLFIRHAMSLSVGDVNYLITKLVRIWSTQSGIDYAQINQAIGVLECAKLELYRRLASPYEDEKIKLNGDVK
jgi:hypothetical protein